MKEAETTTKPASSALQKTKNPHHATRYFFVGLSITAFNYGFYALLANIIINNNDLLWLSSFISTAVTTIVAYILHSKITWKERSVTKASIYRFFIWNILLAVFIGPVFTQLFSLITPLYQLTFNISTSLHLPFTYEFIQSTGAFVLTSIVTMILNFLFYDKFVFHKSRKTPETK